MERSKRDLESVINSQKEQLTRYETRLKDVVTAYKGLLKEKEALEASLSALSNNKHENNPNSKPNETQNQSDCKNAPRPSDVANGKDNLQMQIATLMNSLATLSAEKSRMEASFQADKKQLRQEIVQKEKILRDLQEKLKHTTAQYALDVEGIKSKIIVERHARDKEGNDHMVMIRELQKLLSDERHLKENLEMQLNDLKNQFSTTNYSDRTIKELSADLEKTKKKLKQYESSKSGSNHEESSAILHQLQSEMTQLKQQHAIAIKNEQKRAVLAEERNKKLAALHEERVANLESRLAELSSTVGSYDRLRQQDQENILKLKEKIAQFDSVGNTLENTRTENVNMKDINAIVDEILHWKKLLIIENAKSENPVDISKIFAVGNDHAVCVEEQTKLRADLEKCRKENNEFIESSEIQKNHIKTLQDKIKVLNRNIDDQEHEIKNKLVEHTYDLKAERNKWKEIVSSMELDFRAKVAELEQHLQKQRDRSLMLLEEKENEIKTLKTSFEIFIPGSHNLAESQNTDSDQKKGGSHLGTVLNPASGSTNSMSEPYHMLHYVHELARKDVEISGLRKAKHAAETSLRQALQDKVTAQEELHDKIMNLEEQVDRLERCKSREGANLEYLKNVILSFLITNDAYSKRHMLNAIGAVLKFSPTELKAISGYFSKK